MHVPRLLYKGPSDETATVKRFETESDVEAALAEGWRLMRAGAETIPSESDDHTDDEATGRRKKRR